MNFQQQGIQSSNNFSVNQVLKVDEVSRNDQEIENQLVEPDLKQLQDKLLLLIERNPLPLIEWNTAFQVIQWNLAAEQLFGYSKSEVLGCQVSEIIVPESERVQAIQIMNLLIEEKVGGNNLSKNLTKHGIVIICDWCHTPITNVDGKVISIVSTVQDITKVKSFESALRENEKTYQQILDAITDMVLVKGAKSRIIWANKAFRDYYGMSESQLQNMIDAPFSEADHTLQYIKDDTYVFESGQTLEIPQEPVTRYNGEVRLFHTIKSAIRNELGQVIMTVGVARDISEHKQAQKEQAKLLAILEAAPDFISTADLTGQVLYFNKAARRMLELGEEESVQGRNLSQNHPKWANDIIQNQGLPESVRVGDWVGETAVLKADGREIPISQLIIAHKSPDGEVEYFSTIARDISELKAAEETLVQKAEDLERTLKELQSTQAHLLQSEKMSSIGQLVAGVAHEMNNPLGFIAASVKQAKPTFADIVDHLKLYQKKFPAPGDEILIHAEEIDLEYSLSDLPEMIDSMTIACDRLKDISTSLRTFTRADQDYKIPFNIHQGIDSTILILKHRLKANEQRPKIEVITNYGNLPEVECFPGQLNQVFMNILANAIDALDESNTDRSFREIKANPNRIMITTLLENKQVEVKIADNGQGMSESIKQKVFDDLFTTKGVGKGTGLGLAIAQSIVVEKHGGTLDVNSTPGVGTEFVITLPILAQTQN
ncbi:PAS domain-containing sensor histidine kinase [Nostoc sp. LEGE 12450]|uniref:PAS domain-containing sensor histidine kinase n=1 Tax=Nostoc sp. LEGE 12450 TaxID=1828643 RepID=UPI001880365E|nr:PAS domain S-box protein [Nostoc sp. LEGE 12450]MBE8986737.1 PAS domain-containing sensor histidine kinase [Nostoc sp. LEGE 12450]